MLERWTRTVVRLRLVVLACWAAVVVAGAFAWGALPGLLANSLAVPGSESERARTLLADHFDERPDGTFTVVFRVPGGDRPPPRLARRLRERLEEAARAVPTGHAGELRRGGGIVFADVVTRLPLQEAKGHTDALRGALEGGAPRAWVTGQPALQRDVDPLVSADLRRGEAVAAPLALLVLLTVLGLSGAVAIPFVVALCTILGALLGVYGLAHVVATTTFVTNLVALIGLGLAIDYSLLVVHRFREELEAGLDRDDAVAAAMATAGRTVVFSGAAVAVGLGLLLVVPVPFIRSLGLGGLLVPLVSIAAALTLQPALLSVAGPAAVRRLRVGRRGRGGRTPRSPLGDRFWGRLTAAVMARPKRILAASSAALLILAAPALSLDLVPGSFAAIPGSPESARGLELLRGGVGDGALTPTHVVVDAGAAGAVRRPPVRRSLDRLVDALFNDPEVLVVASGPAAPYVDATGRFARVIVVGRHEYGADASQALVRRLRGRHVPAAGFPAGVTVAAGGAPPQGVDFLARAYGAFPWLLLAALAVTYLVLLRAFRSLLLPLKAVLLNLLVLGAVYGVLVAVFQWGLGGIVGLEQTDAIEGWVPIVLFATLFGLSMDYEVFLVTRMREAWDRVPDNALAVARGLERTGRIVTAAALIMTAAFLGFLAGRIGGLQQLGLGLAVGILLDATLVRALLVPSLMAVLGRFNWWYPGRAALAAPRGR